ncbi:enoyl-CoA hydratase [Terrihabitans soli]|uniref:Enoyl-CoA hydratase n=1 Tax=Terrihabitans soli TaxID=708113 RepID=A0A6S6QR56_9HYPH|nr:enoyl-CoA hydratase [Terrihabitans soli]BCJ90447.1 enoyl-CoA hydratase [Terrihabitans soli]
MGDILHSVEDGIATVTFNRPRARNAMTFEMYERLAEICSGAASDTSVRAIVLTGAGGEAFASGTDIAKFREFQTPEDSLAYEARIGRVLRAVEECAVPTIAALAGACTGGGAAIAACCDLRIAASDLKFGFPIARTLGNTLSLENYARLTALIGPARVKDLIFTARLISAEEAAAWGVVNQIVRADELASVARDLARKVAGHAPLTLRAAKRALAALRSGIDPDLAREINLSCYQSEDFREGVEAFLARRPPVWKGR